MLHAVETGIKVGRVSQHKCDFTSVTGHRKLSRTLSDFTTSLHPVSRDLTSEVSSVIGGTIAFQNDVKL